MIDQMKIYLIFFGLIVLIGQAFNKSSIPLSLLLVIAGIMLSFFPVFNKVTLNPELVLNILLPLLIYQISAFSSWRDIKKNIRPIGLLSIGHVIFITLIVALVIHTLIPQLGWPYSFILGAIISPPDDVAIVSIAEKIRMPERIITILEGEAMFNDAMALILFKFSLVAIITHQFSLTSAANDFFILLIGEALYGLSVGYLIGELRLRIRNSSLHIIASLLTPFIAYFPPEMLGGSGILATVAAGFVIGHVYSVRFSPDFRLFSRSVWPALTFAIQCILFFLVGLNMEMILENISSIPWTSLILYSLAVIFTVVLGRFIWVYVFVVYLPRLIFPSICKKDPYPPWQYPFVISWAGMRGIVSLAAALAIPVPYFIVEGANPRDLIIFLVMSVIIVTFIIQGLSLPWLIKVLGLHKHGQREKYDDHLAELLARVQITKSVLHWLSEYKEYVKDDHELLHEVKLYIQEYRMVKTRLKERIDQHDGTIVHDEETEIINEIFLLSKIIEVEKAALFKLWQKEKINLVIRNRLLERLDHRVQHLSQ